mmetsp:Transcript_4740/g.13259  ORF Transcript_4740/g.13259 Transcript_4740/m.13259 type:complete len:86 (+) Transcript_4740:972-1229(+)
MGAQSNLSFYRMLLIHQNLSERFHYSCDAVVVPPNNHLESGTDDERFGRISSNLIAPHRQKRRTTVLLSKSPRLNPATMTNDTFV